jgi:CheY-like chemotaxis protein
VGCVELLIEERKASGQELLDLQLVRQEAGRAGQIVRNLLSFVRRGSPERSVEDLNQIARVTAALREQHLRDENIRLLVELHPGVLPIKVNREEIQQVVLNLILNAEHAIGDTSGTIVIRTNAGEHAHRLEVMDDGPGVPPELRGRVFEPFFTTKDVGQGTGLGLSIALGIATAHGGSLELAEDSGIRDSSDPGSQVPDPRFQVPDPRRGARFILTLPAHATVEAAQRVVEGVPHASPASGRRRALIAEDEPSVRSLLSRLVARRDYEIVEASSCAEAKAAVAVHTFDLVLCDVRLADGNGAEVLRCLRERQPDLGRRFVFVTGDIGALTGADREVALMPLLSKPFTASDLDQLLDELHARSGTV